MPHSAMTMNSPDCSDLTTRQAEVLTSFCAGNTYKEVASELGLSPQTINPVLKAIARKRGDHRIARRCLC